MNIIGTSVLIFYLKQGVNQKTGFLFKMRSSSYFLLTY